MCKVKNDLGALHNFAQRMPLKTRYVYPSQPRYHSDALNKVYGSLFELKLKGNNHLFSQDFFSLKNREL